MFDFVLKGANASQLEKDIGSDLFPANEHYFGLVNVSFVLNVENVVKIGFRIVFYCLLFSLLFDVDVVLQFCSCRQSLFRQFQTNVLSVKKKKITVFYFQKDSFVLAKNCDWKVETIDILLFKDVLSVCKMTF